jgi:hypothetical protein
MLRNYNNYPCLKLVSETNTLAYSSNKSRYHNLVQNKKKDYKTAKKLICSFSNMM